MTDLRPRTRRTPAFLAGRIALGLAVGTGITVAAALLLWATGAYRLLGWAPRLPPEFALGLPGYAWIEEVLFRLLLLDRLVRWWGRTAGLLVSSAVFAAVHAINPGASVAAGVGVFLAGLWMGQLYLQHRRIWACTAAHLAWNAVLGPVLGFPVSGVALGGLLAWTASGGRLATGGEFGPEASAWSWLVFAAAIVALEWWHRSRPQPAAEPIPPEEMSFREW